MNKSFPLGVRYTRLFSLDYSPTCVYTFPPPDYLDLVKDLHLYLL